MLVLACYRGNYQHGPATRFLDHRCRELSEAEEREDVEVEGAPEIAHRHVERFRSAATRIAHKQGHATKFGLRRVDYALKVLLTGDITCDGRGVSTSFGDPCCCFFSRCQIDIADHDGCARRRERLGDCKTDARSTAGNECYVVIESEGVTVEHVETSSELKGRHRRWIIAADY